MASITAGPAMLPAEVCGKPSCPVQGGGIWALSNPRPATPGMKGEKDDIVCYAKVIKEANIKPVD